MRIDNPTAEDVKIDDMLHFKPLRFKGPFGHGLPFPEIDYIIREDTLEVGDEFTRIDGQIRKVLAVANGWAMYSVDNESTNRSPVHAGNISEMAKENGFKLVRRVNDPR